MKHVDSFSAPFIEEFKLAELLKNTKKTGLKVPSRKELWNKLKEIHAQKKDSVPENFKPKLGLGNKKEPAASKKLTPSQSSGSLAKRTESNGAQRKEKKSSADTTNKSEAPLKRNGSVELIKDDEQDGPAETSKSQAVKQEKKKKFSLGTLMRPGAEEEKSEKKLEQAITSSSSQRTEQYVIPDWVSQPFDERPTDDNRSFALDFLNQAARFIPKRENVNHDSIAQSLEAAVYKWSKKQVGEGDRFDWRALQVYWEKIHALVASISGRDRAGSIGSMIATGLFQSPEDIVSLSDDQLENSFEGRPVVL
jgi:hypothetical protein